MSTANSCLLQSVPQAVGHSAPIVCSMLMPMPELAEALLAIHSSHSVVHSVPGLQLIKQALTHSVGEAASRRHGARGQWSKCTGRHAKKTSGGATARCHIVTKGAVKRPNVTSAASRLVTEKISRRSSWVFAFATAGGRPEHIHVHRLSRLHDWAQRGHSFGHRRQQGHSKLGAPMRLLAARLCKPCSLALVAASIHIHGLRLQLLSALKGPLLYHRWQLDPRKGQVGSVPLDTPLVAACGKHRGACGHAESALTGELTVERASSNLVDLGEASRASFTPGATG